MADDWYFRVLSAEFGPFSASQMRRFAVTGRITSQTEVRKGSQGEWFPAIAIEGLIPTAPPPPISTQPPSTSVQPLPVSASPSPVATGNREPDTPSRLSSFLLRFYSMAATSFQTHKVLWAGVACTGFLLIVVAVVVSLVSAKLSMRAGVRTRAMTTEEVVAIAEPSVAFIEGSLRSGTGFVVREGVVVTNKHVIEAELLHRIKVHFPSAKHGETGPFTADLIYKAPDCDLALLSVNAPHSPLKLAPQHSFRRGQEITVIGNPSLAPGIVLKCAISRGVMSTPVTMKDQEYYQLGISANPGNSGGPVLDAGGEVIGVVTLKALDKEGLGFCIPLHQLTKAVEKIDELSPDDIALIRSRHRAFVVFILLGGTEKVYEAAMKKYLTAMQLAIIDRVNVNVGLEAVRSGIENDLAEFNRTLISDLKQQVSSVVGDPLLSKDMRQQFTALWTNYVELKSYVDNPRGTYESYEAKYQDITSEFNQLEKALMRLLALESDL